MRRHQYEVARVGAAMYASLDGIGFMPVRYYDDPVWEQLHQPARQHYVLRNTLVKHDAAFGTALGPVDVLEFQVTTNSGTDFDESLLSGVFYDHHLGVFDAGRVAGVEYEGPHPDEWGSHVWVVSVRV